MSAELSTEQSIAKRLKQLGCLEMLQSLGLVEHRQAAIKLKEIISNDKRIIDAKRRTIILSNSEDSVLICGPTGVGKETFANALHGDRLGAFVPINTTSLPDYLLESELFGHIRGSFTGAIGDKVGLFESAINGTVFLDEIGDMPLALQAKLLRAIQDKSIRRVGDTSYRPINCRFVFATHRNLDSECARWETSHGRRGFRPDLYWRIATHLITIPGLSERPGDIREIIDARLDIKHQLTEEELTSLESHPLPGNYRQLEALVKRILLDKELSSIDVKV